MASWQCRCPSTSTTGRPTRKEWSAACVGCSSKARPTCQVANFCCEQSDNWDYFICRAHDRPLWCQSSSLFILSKVFQDKDTTGHPREQTHWAGEIWMQYLWKEVSSERRSEEPRTAARRREGLHLRPLWKVFCQRRLPENTHESARKERGSATKTSKKVLTKLCQESSKRWNYLTFCYFQEASRPWKVVYTGLHVNCDISRKCFGGMST